MLLTQSDAAHGASPCRRQPMGSVARRRRRAVFDPLNGNKRQPQLNEFPLAQRVAVGSMTIRHV